MIVFLDTNAVIDFCAHRKDYENVAMIFSLAGDGILKIAISSLTLVNVAYIMRKVNKGEVMSKISLLMENCLVTPIDDNVLRRAKNAGQPDFEDSVQYFSSLTVNSDVIVTNDKTGFSNFEIPVFTPSQFVENCR